MSDTLVEYKCPCCSGLIAFDSEAQNLVCQHCQTEFTVEAIKMHHEAENEKGNETEPEWDEYNENSGNGDWRENEELNLYLCSSCAGEIVADETTSATMCPYCGSPVMLKGRLSGAYRPDYVIPFRISRDEAKQGFEKFMKNKLLLPNDFKKAHKVDKMEGVYVPFWLYDCNTFSKIKYRATRKLVWSDSRYTYTKTSHYLLSREGNLAFERVPADGSTKMNDTYMQAIEPFDYSQMVDFEMPYLVGYLAEKYDVDAKTASATVNERIKESTLARFNQTTGGYATVVRSSYNIKLLDRNTSYALLPVWTINTRYNDKIYTFAMNGQTGKFVGELPISTKKCFKWFGIFAGASALLGAVISIIASLL